MIRVTGPIANSNIVKYTDDVKQIMAYSMLFEVANIRPVARIMNAMLVNMYLEISIIF